MTDRESIVAFIKQKIEAADTVSIVACQNLLAEIERCADLKPAKPKVATPRVLQSADEAPCGALIKDVSDGNYTLRLVDGRGVHVRRYSGAGVDSLPVRGGGAWLWAGSIRNIRGAVEVIAEGLTEAECRHLSSLTAADALAWCERRK